MERGFPDPENFLFLLYGPNSRTKNKAENSANYMSPEYDKGYVKMKAMGNTPEREKIIHDMTDTFFKDQPWLGGYFSESYTLKHEWVKNYKINVLNNCNWKYRAIDGELRAKRRAEWNKPNFILVYVVFGLLFFGSLPAVFSVRRKNMSAD